MKLSHFSYAKSIVPYSTNTELHLSRWNRFDKPFGFWLSVDGEDSWEDFCRREDFRDLDRQNHFRVTLSENANILHLTSDSEILSFSEEYDKPGAYRGRPGNAIDWRRVAVDYQGIMISPYSWEMRRNGPLWYFNWDCQSSCVWDANAISDISLVRRMNANGRIHVAQLLQPYTGASIATQEWML